MLSSIFLYVMSGVFIYIIKFIIEINSVIKLAHKQRRHPTGVGCCVGGAWVNSLSYADGMVLLAPTVTALQTLLEACRAYAGPHAIVYNTTKTVYMLVGQSNHRVGSQQESGSEMRNLALYIEEFRYLGHIMTAVADAKLSHSNHVCQYLNKYILLLNYYKYLSNM